MAAKTKTSTKKKTSKNTSKPSDLASAMSASSVQTKSLKPDRRWFWLFFAAVILGALLYQFKGLFVAALVNGQPVTRLELVNRLEDQYAQQMMDTIVTEKMIYQKAAQQGVTVSDAEVDTEMAKFEEQFSQQGQTLDQLLQLQGIDRDFFRQQIKLQKLVEKLAGSDVEITDEQVEQYIADNKETLGEEVSGAELAGQVREQLRQQEISQKIQSWLVTLRGEANVKYWINL